MRVKAAIRLLRRQPFDISSEEGRSAERYRRAAISVLANVLGRGLGMVVMLLGVSLTVPYLGAERFGVWMTIMSFSAMLSFLDLGTGNALTNQVAASAAHGNAMTVRQVISGGLGLLALIGTAVAFTLVGLAAVLPWDRLLRSTQPLVIAEAREAAMWFGALFGAGIFTSGIQRVYSGLQRAFEAHIAAACASVISIAGLWLCTNQHAGVSALLIVTLGVQLTTALPLLIVLARRDQLGWREVTNNTCDQARKLAKVGTMFLALQLGVMLGWGADSLIVSSTLGVAQVAVYSVTQRLVQLISIPLSLANSPLWPAYADAYATGDVDFIRKTLKRSLAMTLTIAVSGAAVITFVAEAVIARWTHGHVEVTHAVVLTFGLWMILEATGNAFAMFLNGCSVIRPQVTVLIIFCILVTPLKFLLVRHFGISGILAATIVSYLISVPCLYATIFRRTIADTLRSSAQSRRHAAL